MHACRNTFLAQALQWGRGLDKRDLSANVNFFMNVPMTPDGGLTFEDGISAPGKALELRADRDTLVLISNCPQLNNPCNGYDPTPVRLIRRPARPARSRSSPPARWRPCGTGPGVSATGRSACRRRGRWTIAPFASATGSSATPRA